MAGIIRIIDEVTPKIYNPVNGELLTDLESGWYEKTGSLMYFEVVELEEFVHDTFQVELNQIKSIIDNKLKTISEEELDRVSVFQNNLSDDYLIVDIQPLAVISVSGILVIHLR